MKNDKIKEFIITETENALLESPRKVADEYAALIKNKDPDLYDNLMRQAEFAIMSVKNDYKPTQKLITLNRLYNQMPDIDPRKSGDTHGVRLFIDYLVYKADPEKGGKLAGQAKRWYQQTIDSLLRKTLKLKKEAVHEFSYEFKNYLDEYFSNTLLEVSTQTPIKKKFKMDLPFEVLRLADIFAMNGYQIFVVGGAVRDALMGKTPKDYDLVTNAEPNEIVNLLGKHEEYKILEVGKAFGVINVITPEGEEFEIATFRKDIGSGRRPDAVEFTSIEQDARRRDLSINALYYDVTNEEIIDFGTGIEDIKHGRVRTVGSPEERFKEDRLRILRAIRFAARLGAGMGEETENAILKDNSLNGVSAERIRDEFIKSVKTAKSVQSLLRMYDTFDMWKQVFPGLKINKWYHETKNWPILLSLLLRDNNPSQVKSTLNKLKYTTSEIKQVVFLLMFQGLNPENALKLKKMWATTNLSNDDLLEFIKYSKAPSTSLVKAFIKFAPSVKGDVLLKKGFSGKELGKEIERQEIEIFKKML